ncbi:MAG: GNAT family N-acetyltransferase [Phycisphaeraceae bacterium]|nr:GNAT family N-acetyltransferase [Phycisphaeraceae bacterium]
MAPTTIYHLEMIDREAFSPQPAPVGFEVTAVDPPDPDFNRRFYREVGEAWQWTDRREWSDDQWHDYVYRDALKTWVGRQAGEPAGYFELESQADGDVEIVYFGLLPAFIGRGLGGPLLSAAVESAWNLPDTRRVWVHTCTDDHPHALENYRRRGFEVFKIEEGRSGPEPTD